MAQLKKNYKTNLYCSFVKQHTLEMKLVVVLPKKNKIYG